ncbi:mannose-6-phosphate isomerase, class I [Trueperella bialowiezensis]|uniref:mannose-6-phosphate isomerase n=1 Tax=Trueperella bialowiezensis TaxID=312285 RepID=A0A3S4UYN7_9ACTO|nr:mannose-6-phosphate isomerase, class I [Trueperella bialowiezensis]VEI13091.1 Mannose-6-phosphate isomerase [Trueperella bialowiezensis]
MHVIQGRVKDYDWGAAHLIPGTFGKPAASFPVAELWLGAHPAGPARCDVDSRAIALNDADLAAGEAGRHARERAASDLRGYIAADPEGTLGADVVNHHGGQLPYLLKLIAPAKPLSLQVHPSLEQARIGFDREEAAGIDVDAAERSYKDRNHKPELVYAMTQFEALVGFRTPRRILGVLEGLNTELTDALAACIRAQPDARGVRDAFASLLQEDTRPDAQAVADVVAACQNRPADDSPSPRADAIIAKLAANYPGDPGAVASLLLNPVTLQPGEAMFTPAGTVHAYTSGLGLEIMANSDNVLRAGLTSKYVNVPELLNIVETVAAPPIRIAPERISPIQSTHYAPVDDFELSIIELRHANRTASIRGAGPRIILALEGACELWTESGQQHVLNTGQAVFVRADDGKVRARGFGRFVQADVP